MKHIPNSTSIILGLILFIYIMIGYFIFWPFKVIDIIENPYIVGTSIAGETLDYYYHIYKYINLQGKVTIQLIDGCSIKLPTLITNFPVGEQKGIAKVDLPDWVPAHKFRAIITIEYQVNPLRTIIYSRTTDSFTVHRKIYK
jgi:hypothetical protein